MKKTIVVLLVALLTASFTFAQSAPEVAQTTGPMTITMLYSATQTEAGALPDDWAGYKILEDKLGIKLELQMLPSNPNDQDLMVRAMAAADELPDFMTCSREVWSDLAKNGQLYDVTDLYSLMPNRCSVMFDDAAKNFVTYEGRIYGFATPSATKLTVVHIYTSSPCDLSWVDV